MKRLLPVLFLSLLILMIWSGSLSALQQAVRVTEPVSRPIPPASAASTPTQQPTPLPAPTSTPTPQRLITLYAAAPNFAGVNLRTGPGTEFSLVKTLPHGTHLQATDSAYWDFTGKRWYKVRSEDVEGYALGSLLSERRPAERPPTPTPVPTNSPAVVAQGRTDGVWTLTAVGDVMLSRSVLNRMHSYGSYSHPYEQTYNVLRAADLTVANLEGQLSDNAQADVVIPYFHWGSEYVGVPDGRQRSLAYAAIDAGADLVLGAHPHWVQTVEWYEGKPIVYSLGNFVFDQMWSRTTRQGVIATFTFAGSEVIKTRYSPVLIEDYSQPRLATGTDYWAVLSRMGVEEVEP